MKVKCCSIRIQTKYWNCNILNLKCTKKKITLVGLQIQISPLTGDKKGMEGMLLILANHKELFQNEFYHSRICYQLFAGTKFTREDFGVHFMGEFDPVDFALGLSSKPGIEAETRKDTCYPYTSLFTKRDAPKRWRPHQSVETEDCPGGTLRQIEGFFRVDQKKSPGGEQNGFSRNQPNAN